jgi:hypothetical protein
MLDDLVWLDGPERAVGRQEQQATVFGLHQDLALNVLLLVVTPQRDAIDGHRSVRGDEAERNR